MTNKKLPDIQLNVVNYGAFVSVLRRLQKELPKKERDSREAWALYEKIREKEMRTYRYCTVYLLIQRRGQRGDVDCYGYMSLKIEYIPGGVRPSATSLLDIPWPLLRKMIGMTANDGPSNKEDIIQVRTIESIYIARQHRRNGYACAAIDCILRAKSDWPLSAFCYEDDVVTTGLYRRAGLKLFTGYELPGGAGVISSYYKNHGAKAPQFGDFGFGRF